MEFTAFVGDLKLHEKRGAADLSDQLLRAAASVCLNIAEGAGEYARGDKARFS